MAARYLPQSAIDRTRWDAAVAADCSRLPYALSWWLDAVCHHWDGIVFDDYRAVYPLPRGRFWRRYTQVQRPFYTQQCGPFGKLMAGDVANLFTALPRLIRSFIAPLSESADAREVPANRSVDQRTNLVLKLGGPTEELTAGYHKKLRRHLRRFSPALLSVTSPAVVLDTYRANTAPRAGTTEQHHAAAQRLMNATAQRGPARLFRLDDANGLLAAGFFPEYRGRTINLFAASTPAGYEDQGMARLLHAIILHDRAEGHLFDFEGSDHPGIGAFFRQFGGSERPYITIS